MRYRLRTLLILLALLPPILAVIGPPMMEWLTKEPPPVVKVVKPVTTPAPYFAVYTLGKMGKVKAAEVHVVLNQLFAGSSVRMQVDPQAGTVAILAPAVDHAAVQALISAIEQFPPPPTVAEIE